VRIDNFEPEERILITDGRTLWFYNPLKRTVARKNFENAEGQIMTAGIEGIAQHNPFALLGGGYDCSRIEDFESHFIIKCSSKEDALAVSYVLMKVNPSNWMVSAYEVFDKQDTLVSQTKFFDFVPIASAWFPARVETRVQLGNGAALESVSYSRVRINESLEDSLFAFSVPDGVQVIDVERPGESPDMTINGGG
jgi:outer membrane lipoprotein-sorting protein